MQGKFIIAIAAVLAAILLCARPVQAQDFDSDGMPDAWEIAHGCLMANTADGGVDYDIDDMTSLAEYQFSPELDPCDPDTDGDGVNDGAEASAGGNPLLISVTPAFSETGEEVRITYNDHPMAFPSISWRGSEFGLAWGGLMPETNIYFTRMTAAGDTIGSSVQLSSSNYRKSPALVWIGSEFGMSWSEERDNTNWEIFFTRVSAEGVQIGSDIRITNDPNDSDYSSLAATDSGFGVCWHDSRYGNAEIYFAVLLGDGSTIGSEVRLTNAPGDGQECSVVWTGSEFGLSWYDSRDGNYEIYFARVSDQGIKIGGDLRVTSNGMSSWRPSLAFTGTEFGIAWYDNRNGQNEIYFTRVSATGTKIGDDLLLTNGPAGFPSLLWNDGVFGLTWMDTRDGNNEIYFAVLAPSGARMGADLRVTSLVHSGFDPVISWSGSEFGLSWMDSASGNGEIYLARIGLDQDGDGLDGADELSAGTDPADWDSDDDGLTDGEEINTSFTNPLNPDSDSDGLTDGYEINTYFTNPLNPDSDSDGLTDGYEVFTSLTSPTSDDTDSDGINDFIEVNHACLNALNNDTDGEGLIDGTSVGEDKNNNGVVDMGETNPCLTDTDGDGLDDYYELNVSHTDPCGGDADGDGLADGDEIAIYGTNPFDADTDNDGLSDYDEVTLHLTDPNWIDTDGDGLSDWSEVYYYGDTDATIWDTDGDGLSDGYEVYTGTASGTSDTDGDGMPDSWEDSYSCVDALVGDSTPDADGDGLRNLEEFIIGGHPCLTDTDGDNLSDYDEFFTYGTNPIQPDTDGDGLTDYEEPFVHNTYPLDFDSDNDGFSDGNEVAHGTDPLDPASHPEPAWKMINYQGRLRDSDNMPVKGTVSITFRVFETQSGGLDIWTETQNVFVSDGLYNVLLGSVTPWPDIFDRQELFLEVEVENEVMAPRQRLSWVPYAFNCDKTSGLRIETDTRTFSVVKPSLEITVHVSFKKVFQSKPVVTVSPPSNPLQNKRFVPAEINNITTEGFDVVFQTLTGAAATGSSTFTYIAFGN